MESMDQKQEIGGKILMNLHGGSKEKEDPTMTSKILAWVTDASTG